MKNRRKVFDFLDNSVFELASRNSPQYDENNFTGNQVVKK